MENIKIITLDDGIGVFENAFPIDFCEGLISHFEYMNSMGKGVTRKVENCPRLEKNDSACNLSPENLMNVWQANDYIEEINNINISYQNFIKIYLQSCYNIYNDKYYTLETLSRHDLIHIKLQKTSPGEGYHIWHTEYDKSCPYRILAVIVYLNDVEEGGETEFLFQHKRIKPKAGTALIFPAYFTHPHRGNPPLSNNKYILSSWYEFI